MDLTFSKPGCRARHLSILQKLNVPGGQEQVKTWGPISGVLDGGLLAPPLGPTAGGRKADAVDLKVCTQPFLGYLYACTSLGGTWMLTWTSQHFLPWKGQETCSSSPASLISTQEGPCLSSLQAGHRASYRVCWHLSSQTCLLSWCKDWRRHNRNIGKCNAFSSLWRCNRSCQFENTKCFPGQALSLQHREWTYKGGFDWGESD